MAPGAPCLVAVKNLIVPTFFKDRNHFSGALIGVSVTTPNYGNQLEIVVQMSGSNESGCDIHEEISANRSERSFHWPIGASIRLLSFPQTSHKREGCTGLDIVTQGKAERELGGGGRISCSRQAQA